MIELIGEIMDLKIKIKLEPVSSQFGGHRVSLPLQKFQIYAS